MYLFGAMSCVQAEQTIIFLQDVTIGHYYMLTNVNDNNFDETT